MRSARRAEIDAIVEEGLYLASAATRLTLKNRILVEVLARGADFEPELFVEQARDVLLGLADEAEADATRFADARRRASRRFSESDGTHDYRSRDSRNLRRREQQSAKVAASLRARAADGAALAELVAAARDAAWDDVSNNIDRTLRIEAARPDLEPDYAEAREQRMADLLSVDLARLAESRGRPGLVAVAEGAEPDPDAVDAAPDSRGSDA